MQFNLPQFIDVEDRIVGPFTLKQILYLGAAGAVLFFAWYLLEFWAFLLIAIPVGGLALALAFIQINGRPFIYYLGSFINYLRKPKLYVWKKK